MGICKQKIRFLTTGGQKNHVTIEHTFTQNPTISFALNG